MAKNLKFSYDSSLLHIMYGRNWQNVRKVELYLSEYYVDNVVGLHKTFDDLNKIIGTDTFVMWMSTCYTNIKKRPWYNMFKFIKNYKSK